MRRDAVVGGLLALVSGVLLWQTREIPHPPFVPLGPAFYPRVVLSVFLALSLVLMASGLRSRATPKGRDWPAFLRRYRLILVSFAVFGLYVLAMPILGFLLSTALFTAGMQWVLGRRGLARLPAVLAIAAGTAGATYLVFERYLYVLLPRGLLLP